MCYIARNTCADGQENYSSFHRNSFSANQRNGIEAIQSNQAGNATIDLWLINKITEKISKENIWP